MMLFWFSAVFFVLAVGAPLLIWWRGRQDVNQQKRRHAAEIEAFEAKIQADLAERRGRFLP